VGVIRVHPQLAARVLDDRRGLAAVIGVRVTADEQANVLQLQSHQLERALELGERPGFVHPGVDEHDPVARRECPGVAVGHAWPRQRQPQPPDAGEHPLTTAELAPACGRCHADNPIGPA